MATINLARTIPTDYRFLDSVTWYADLSKVYLQTQKSHTSSQLVLGCLLAAHQHLFVYVDWIIGQNMWFAGGPGIGLNLPETADATVPFKAFGGLSRVSRSITEKSTKES